MRLLDYRANDKKAKTRADDCVDTFTMAIIKGWDLEVPGPYSTRVELARRYPLRRQGSRIG